jgi:hypothetical protein
MEKRIEERREISLEQQHFVARLKRQPCCSEVDPRPCAGGEHDFFRKAAHEPGAQLARALRDLKIFLSAQAKRVGFPIQHSQERLVGAARQGAFAGCIEVDGFRVKVELLPDIREGRHVTLSTGR